MFWAGKRLDNMADITEAACALSSKEEAERFLAEYEVVTPFARDNLGYMLGNGIPDDARLKLIDWLDLHHPVFGQSIPTADEAFRAGMRIGELSKVYGDRAYEMYRRERRLVLLVREHGAEKGLTLIQDEFPE